jgi:hypothetical protein
MLLDINWDYIKDQITNSSHFTYKEQEDLINELSSLRDIVGEEIFSNKQHPIFSFVHNTAPWTRKWFYHLSKNLNVLKSSENFSSIVKRLKSLDKFYESISVIDIASPLKKENFEVTFDSKVQVEKRKDKKEPDIRLFNPYTNESVFVEVTESHASYEETEANRTYVNMKGEFIFDDEIDYYIKIHMVLSPPRIQELSQEITNVINDVKKNRKLKTIEIEGVIDAGFVLKSDKGGLVKWAESKSMKHSYQGPPTEIDEVTRIKSKVRLKKKQLPKDAASIITIHTSKMHFIEKDLEESIRKIAEQVYEFQNIFCVVIYGSSYLDGEEITKNISGNIYKRKYNRNIGCDDLIIIYNRYFNVTLSEDTKNRLYNSLINI